MALLARLSHYDAALVHVKRNAKRSVLTLPIIGSTPHKWNVFSIFI
jgi:hypothetical protein